MIFRTLLYSLLFYGVFWILRRFLGGLFGTPKKPAQGRKRPRRFSGQAVDADFEVIDDPPSDNRPKG